MEKTILRTTQLSKSYTGRMAVSKINMTIRKGEIYGFIGENGAGKTTLLRLITSLILPSSGEIELFGSSKADELQQARTRIGSMIETPVFFPKMTARENLEYYWIQRGLVDENEIERVLQLVNLSDTGRKKFHQFSLGMKQRLGLALAIMGNPEFLILDEPINGLDPTGMIEFRNLIKRLNEEYQTTILISSHILSELAHIATRYGIIHQGKMLKEFTQEELAEDIRGFISLKVDDARMAGGIIRSALDNTNFEVVSKEEIHLFSFFDDPSIVIETLSSNGIKVYSSNEVKINLEDYFVSVINAA
ncbi:ATP-binding cassette domain-containing protein [Candidatus Enterococcus ferrettii]|uniref:ABC-2 type transport system ATP-binding protein n=1 Tax=Candidatus Enterococcus ferrettii TaxID=2815324 RepID=A0ABV0EZF4_9ENTE|nr:ATP-binding cassette domain-containing protein [Enterococcus sp. 665A]MBO1340627.1 ATP-binding cassette domain-containing protein [Enterococcus sp. 665A]